MKYYLLGKSGPRVSEICLGTMTFDEEWGWDASKEECHKIFNTYVEETVILSILLTNIMREQVKNLSANLFHLIETDL